MQHIKMCNMDELGYASDAVFQVLGEPAVCINGVPEVSPVGTASVPQYAADDAKSCDEPFLGEWLEGREVRKLFGSKYYSGKVVQFDPEMKWYRVVYEDGDYEDLEWHELEEVLVPLNVTVSLKTLASQVCEYHSSVTRLDGNTTKPGKQHFGNVKSVN